MIETIAMIDAFYFILQKLVNAIRVNFSYTGTESNGLSLFDWHFEITRHKQIF